LYPSFVHHCVCVFVLVTVTDVSVAYYLQSFFFSVTSPVLVWIVKKCVDLNDIWPMFREPGSPQHASSFVAHVLLCTSSNLFLFPPRSIVVETLVSMKEPGQHATEAIVNLTAMYATVGTVVLPSTLCSCVCPDMHPFVIRNAMICMFVFGLPVGGVIDQITRQNL
jgi:hypothetical protein